MAHMRPNMSPYTYCSNNPINRVDPTGMLDDTYLDAKTGAVLGQDGATTDNVRVINKSDWDSTVATHGGSTSAAATTQLQQQGGLVTVNSEQIQSDLNTINSQTINDQSRERQVLIGLKVNTSGDYPTAELTSVIGSPGEGGGSVDTLIDNFALEDGTIVARKFTGTALRPIAQVHTHNTVTEANKINVPRTSPEDKASSAADGLIRYSVDSWRGNISGGNAIHRVTPNGTQTNNIGTTQSSNIGLDALQQHLIK